MYQANSLYGCLLIYIRQRSQKKKKKKKNFPLSPSPLPKTSISEGKKRQPPRRRPIGHPPWPTFRPTGATPAAPSPPQPLRRPPPPCSPSPSPPPLAGATTSARPTTRSSTPWAASPAGPRSRLFPPGSDDAESFRLVPFPCDPIERKTGAKPLVLAPSSPKSFPDSTEAAVAVIADRFFPDLLAAAERARATAHDAPTEDEEVKLSLVARVGKVLFQPGPSGGPVSLDSVRDAAKAGAEGSKSQVRKSFYTNLPGKCLDDIGQFVGKLTDLEIDSSKEHYHVKVFDKQLSDSTMSCKCTVQEDGKLAIHKVELNQIRQLVEDISCLFNDLDLRLMFSTKRILKNIDPEVEDAIKSLVSSAIVDPDAKGGLRWAFGNESIGERFSIVGVWHTNYKAFRNKTLRLKLRCADRFDHWSSTGEISNEVTFKLTGISKRLQDGNQEVDTLKGMLESAVQMIWDTVLNYKI